VTDSVFPRQKLAGVACLVAAAVALLGTFLTWLQGGSACKIIVDYSYSKDLWQLALPVHASLYSLAIFLVVGSAFILCIAGVNELGTPMLRWLDRWRWAPAAASAALLLVSALTTWPQAPASNIECTNSATTGPGRWLCILGAALAIAAAPLIWTSSRSHGSNQDGGLADIEEPSRIAS